MFFCYVLMGLWTKGDKTMFAPPIIDEKHDSTDRYDSTVDKEENPAIFVSCYKDDMAYPAFLITFEEQT